MYTHESLVGLFFDAGYQICTRKSRFFLPRSNSPWLGDLLCPLSQRLLRSTAQFPTNSTCSLSSKQWNSLPENVKRSTDLQTFKRLIKTWDGPACHCNFCMSAGSTSRVLLDKFIKSTFQCGGGLLPFLIISGAAVTTLFLRAPVVLYELWVLSGRPGGGCLPAGVHCV